MDEYQNIKITGCEFDNIKGKESEKYGAVLRFAEAKKLRLKINTVT